MGGGVRVAGRKSGLGGDSGSSEDSELGDDGDEPDIVRERVVSFA